MSLPAPSVENDFATSLVNTPVSIDLLANDNGNWVSGSLTQPANGTVTVIGPGAIIQYTPDANFTGIDKFTYTLKDSSGPSFMALVTVTVSTNPASVVQDDYFTTQRNTGITFDIIANDTGTWVNGSHSQPLHGTTVELGNGVIEYTPKHDYLGYDKFTYQVTDNNGVNLTGTVTVNVLAHPAPDVRNDSAHIRPDTSVVLDLLLNDTGDWASGNLNPPANGTVQGVGSGVIQYTPNPGFVGDEVFTYTLTDTNGVTPPQASVSIAVDNAPIMHEDFASTNTNNPVGVSVLDNDDFSSIASTSFTQPEHGTVTGGGPTLTYTPDTGFTGFDRFSYTLTDTDGNSATERVAVGVNSVVFTDVTAAAGIDYVQCVAPCTGPPTPMTGGAAAGDFDGDGNVDLYVTRMDAPDILYYNNGDGTFTDITGPSGINRGNGSNGAAWGDVDNDGDLDLYVTSVNDTRFYLYINNFPNAFSEEAVPRGASIQGVDVHDGFSVSFGDYNKDGYLDIHTNEWRKDAKNTTGAPSNSRLLRNQGAANPGFFEDVTQAAGVALDGVDGGAAAGTFAFTSRFVDLDNDGWLDLTIAADAKESRLFWNNGDGTFTDGTIAAGVGGDAGDENGMGSTIADVNGDNLPDWFISSIYDPDAPCAQGSGAIGTTGNRLYINNGNRTFTDATTALGVRDGGWGWGATFIDYDNDGDQDLVHTNGFRVARELATHCWWDDQVRFFENAGDSTFTEKASKVGLFDTANGKGLLKFDYDNDGDLDVFIVNTWGKPVLYRNDGGNANDWLRVKFATTEQHIGARIEVEAVAGGPKQYWDVNNNSNFLAQDEVIAHFGLGQGVNPVFKVNIRMPSGTLKVFNDVPRNSMLVVTD